MKRKQSLRAAYAEKQRAILTATGSTPQSALSDQTNAQARKWPAKRARAPLKRQSAKRAKENREYTAKRKAFLIAHPLCEIRTAHCTNIATDIHHGAGRAGKFLLDQGWWFTACRNCHQWCHQHSNTARELGFIAPRGA